VATGPDTTPVAKLDPGQTRVALSVSLTDSNGNLVTGAEVGFIPDGQTTPLAATAVAGVSTVMLGSGASGTITTAAPYAGGAITAADALAALRMGLGLQPSFGTADAFDFIRADVTQDGRVDAADALAILRAALGLTGPAAPRWAGIDAGTDLTGVNAGAVPQAGALNVENLTNDRHIDAIAILLGDVDDSYLG
jgi:hypothetical protein